MRQKFTPGDVPFRKANLRSFIEPLKSMTVLSASTDQVEPSPRDKRGCRL